MKKLFLLLAFTGIVGAASATSIATINKSVITVNGDEKKGDDKKKKEEKSCCKKEGSAKACSGEAKGAEAKSCHGEAKAGEAKSCCKKGATASSTEEKK